MRYEDSGRMRGASRLSVLTAATALLVSFQPAASQSVTDPGVMPAGSAETTQQRGGRDFLFGAPAVTLSLRGGYNFARAGGDVFDHTRQFLTVNRRDFGAFAVAADLGVRVTPRLDVLFSFAHEGTSVRSEFKDWVDQNELPIEQRTRFSQTPLTAGLRYYLVPRGREIGRFVWIPTRVVPYIGVAIGGVYYSFDQTGDWVDFQDLAVFTDQLESSGWTGIGQAMGGVDVALTPWMGLVAEGRFSMANASPGSDFRGFDGIDLTGLQFTVGLSFRM